MRAGSRLGALRPVPTLALLLVLTVALTAGAVRAQSPADSPSALHANGAAPPRPASGLMWTEVPNDAGRAIDLRWMVSPDDSTGAVREYLVERALSPGGPWAIVDSVSHGVSAKQDQTVSRDLDYFYRITTVGPGGAAPSLAVSGPARAHSEWLNSTRWSMLTLTVLFFVFVLYFMTVAQSGKKPYVRRIPGVDAIEEAIGRATEMGRPVLYIPGILDIDDIQTVAGLVILESVARLTAKYQTQIKVPVSYPIPFTIAEEMVKSGYVHAGRADQYDPQSVQFVSPEQFAYVAAVTGIMLRDRPAAHIFMGAFYAESLLLAETGFQTGAIQVAGTANVHQLPFFVVACDYTLIGEELYAASAYLSGEPKLVGGLKGADLMKLVVIAIIVVGCVLETVALMTQNDHLRWLSQWLVTQ